MRSRKDFNQSLQQFFTDQMPRRSHDRRYESFRPHHHVRPDERLYRHDSRDDSPHRHRRDSRDDSPRRHHLRDRSPFHSGPRDKLPERDRPTYPDKKIDDNNLDLAVHPLVRSEYLNRPDPTRSQSSSETLRFFTKQQYLQSVSSKINGSGEIKETLFEKIAKSAFVKQHINNNAMDVSLYERNKNQYSQNILLEKINSHLTASGKRTIGTEGHCHGITLLWLTMMSWGLEPLFYKMTKQIAECPITRLNTINDCVMTFLDWIDLGQNPGDYSNNHHTQRDIKHILGGVIQIAMIEKEIKKDMLASIIQLVEGEDHMICIAGKGTLRSTNTRGGHTIGLFTRKMTSGKFFYSVFDSNYTDNEPRIFSKLPMAAEECWIRVCRSLVDQDTHTIELDAVTVIKNFPPLEPEVISSSPTKSRRH